MYVTVNSLITFQKKTKKEKNIQKKSVGLKINSIYFKLQKQQK